MTTQEPSRTPLVDAFIRRAAEGMADATWCDQHGNPITLTEEDVEYYASRFPAGISPKTIEGTKRLVQEGKEDAQQS